MKYIPLIVISLTSSLFAFSQDVIPVAKMHTVHIAFNDKVKYVDIGSDIIIAGIAGNTPGSNMIRVKALREFSGTTNISVITENGTFHTFIINFCATPTTFFYDYRDKGHIATSTSDNTSLVRDSIVAQTANNIYRKNANILAHIGSSKARLDLYVKSIYIQNDDIYVTLAVDNKSSISYRADDIKFRVITRESSKRSISQSFEIQPKYSIGNIYSEHKKTSHTTIVLPKFTLSEQNLLTVEIYEKGGNRTLSCEIAQLDILKAVRL